MDDADIPTEETVTPAAPAAPEAVPPTPTALAPVARDAGKGSDKTEKARRLASALRDNLRRRKAAVRPEKPRN